MLRIGIGLICLVALPGCLNQEWVKPGVTPEAVQRDLSDCEQQSVGRAKADARMAGMDELTQPGAGPASVHMAQVSAYERRMLQLQADCMHRLGYEVHMIAQKR